MKITRYRDIPQYTESGRWECDYDLVGVVRFVENEKTELKLNLDPDFQRGHVWTEAQQKHFIEFHLRGGVTGRVLYFNHPGWQRDYKGEFVIVDGKQRYEAIRRFVGNELKVFGSYCNEFTDNIRLHNSIRINVNNLPNRAAVLNWYLELNTGGTPHTKAEIAKVLKLLKAEM